MTHAVDYQRPDPTARRAVALMPASGDHDGNADLADWVVVDALRAGRWPASMGVVSNADDVAAMMVMLDAGELPHAVAADALGSTVRTVERRLKQWRADRAVTGRVA